MSTQSSASNENMPRAWCNSAVLTETPINRVHQLQTGGTGIVERSSGSRAVTPDGNSGLQEAVRRPASLFRNGPQ